ncbi:PTS sugar transporter subunit IIA, partial [candidate division KSB1 bacterium]|nr:PTS sugar transporter subunit IIA [candidate division KSB1 bacterium]
AADFLKPESIIARLVTPTRDEAVEQLANRVAKHVKALSCSGIAKGAMEREHEFGTAIGCGVAIPHFRIKGLLNPVLAYGRAPDGIEWDAPDGKPVHHVFFLATPAGAADLHVQILSSIAQALHSADNRQLLDQATDEKDLHGLLDKVLATGKK